MYFITRLFGPKDLLTTLIQVKLLLIRSHPSAATMSVSIHQNKRRHALSLIPSKYPLSIRFQL